MKKHTIVLGGIGGDSHSVGIILLRWTLERNGFNVLYLGIHNSIEKFFEVAPFANLAMISCMDGHARQYLKEFPLYLSQKRPDALWYLGGNPSVEELVGEDRTFIEMGFSRVFLKFIELDKVVEVIKNDLSNVEPISLSKEMLDSLMQSNKESCVSPDNNKMLDTEHLTQRKDVLQHWKTGNDAKNLNDNAETLIKSKNLAYIENKVNQNKRPILIQPRTGVALPEEQLKLFQAMISHGADVVSFQIDSMTRNNNYVAAEEGIRESKFSKQSTINGYPAVNHGVKPLRKISSIIERPIQFRHSTKDPRLLAEICFAGGITAFEGGSICYNMPYFRDYPLENSIRKWQYVDRLCGIYYEKFNIVIHREFFGVLTGTLISPCIAVATGILEALLAAEQGVKCVALGFAETGSRAQDMATIHCIKKMAREYLDNFGYKDVIVSAIFNQYMAAFPLMLDKAKELIIGSAETSRLAGATRILTKTAVEAFKIPTMADNIEGLTLNHKGVNNAENLTVNETQIENEINILNSEVACIVNHVLTLGKDDVAQGIVKAFDDGSIDIPFSPSIYNQGKVITARDVNGAIRFISTGNLPFTKDIIQFHEEKMTERRREEKLNIKQDYRLIEKDLLSVARGQFEYWPLGKN